MKRPGYRFKPADFGKLSTYSITERKSVVNTGMFTDLETYRKSGFYADLLPDILKGRDIRNVVDAIRTAKSQNKPVVVGMGAHVIKCGMAPILIDLMERGFIDAVAMNGACAVHDLEIAYHGATSEIVADEIKEGRFGMVRETAEYLNGALARFVSDETGFGAALGRFISEEKTPHGPLSIIGRGYELGKPVTVHVAIGADIVHIDPTASGEITGRATMNDFKLFTGIVGELGNGGVYLNIGSAVILPEVFIKALSAARNLGNDVTGFTTVNMDMIQHYRPHANVVNRPIQGAGKGISLTGHHEIMIPLVYHLLLEEGKSACP